MNDAAWSERFKRNFLRRVVPRLDGCQVWVGPRQRNGYGLVWCRDRQRLAHRVAFEAKHGAIPDGLCVLHRCDNPPCVNPDHLFLGTKLDNARDAMRKGRTLRGQDNGNAKLSASAVRQIRAVYAAGGGSQRALAAKFCVSQSQIGKIVRMEVRRGDY